MRPLALAAVPVLAGLVLAAAPPAPAANAPTAAPILVVADVGESAARTMPGALWRKLVADYLGARLVVAEDGTALPDDAHCRSAHAAFAVLATFDRAMRLPGFAQDIDRVYAIARFTVRDCVTGAVTPMKTIRIESEPLSQAARVDGDDTVAAAMWQRAVRASLAHEPFVLAATAPAPAAAAAAAATAGRTVRITNIVDGVVFLDGAGGFALNQVLRDYAGKDAKPRAPIQLVVVEVTRRYVAATVIGDGIPHVGDLVDATPVR